MEVPPATSPQACSGYHLNSSGHPGHQDHQYHQYGQQSSDQQNISQPQEQQAHFQFDQQQNLNVTGGQFDPNNAADTASQSFSVSDSPLTNLSRSIGARYQLLLDTITPHWASRWTFSLVILLIFMARIVIAQGCPKIDPAFQAGGEFDVDDFDNSDLGPMLPTKANDEFRPFIRRLPEFKFWLSATKATLISLFLTLFEMFDLPVFWPILLLYFILLFISTMRQQIKHMIRYGYVPWDKGKKKYGNQIQEPASFFSPST